MLADGVWGIGFASDGLMQSGAVRDWAELAEGESVRFFPSLRRSCEDLPDELVGRVLDRAAQIEQDATASSSAKTRGARRREGRQSLGGGGSRAVTPTGTNEDATWLRSLITSREVRGEVRDLRPMARFAFLTGIHPAYLWPQVEILPNWGATAAWLGELSRRGRAIMPPEVADFLNDALAQTQGETFLRDASLAELLTDQALASILLRAAKRSLAGESAQVRWRGGGAISAFSVRAAMRRTFTRVMLNFSRSVFRRAS